MKISIDIEQIKDVLCAIGYAVSDCIQRDNNGKNWQIKFSNSGASVTIYDSNRLDNSVVNGRPEPNEKEALKRIVDALKRNEFEIDPLNHTIVQLIRNNAEKTFCDFKKEFVGYTADLLHDILCLSNNTENRDAYLIHGVTDDCKVVGVNKEVITHELYDFLKSKQFAGDHLPEVEVKRIYYKHNILSVIVCKSSKHVPFYLTDKYQGVFSHQIYTRTGDTNTPKNKHASYSDIETLWRIHFKRENE